jgi:hypothetical protein
MKRGYMKIAMIVMLLTGMMFFAGCEKDEAVSPQLNESSVTPELDAAEVTSGAVGEDTGGLVDQLGDAVSIAGPGGFQSLGKTSAGETVEAVYDSVNGIWAVTIHRERSNPHGNHSLVVDRVYEVQFLNAQNEPQKHWITNGDTARTINFNIISGSGYHKTPHKSGYLNQLEGSFVITNAHLPNVTINGNYLRSASDTLTTRNMERTLNYTLTLEVMDLVGPRGHRNDISNKVSGTITGHLSAVVTFTRGDAYGERQIEKDFTIVIGSGSADIRMGGKIFRGDLKGGDLVDNG